MEALGVIETRDLVALVGVSNAMAKAARVKLVGAKQIGDGLCTAMVRDDAAARRATTDVGATTTQRTGKLVSIHITPRPYDGLEEISPTGPKGDSNNL